ncbi:unnamed protein product, partial [marine sediment metagenome]
MDAGVFGQTKLSEFIAEALYLLARKMEISGIEQLAVRVAEQELLSHQAHARDGEALCINLVETDDAVLIGEVFMHGLYGRVYRSFFKFYIIGGVNQRVLDGLRREIA